MKKIYFCLFLVLGITGCGDKESTTVSTPSAATISSQQAIIPFYDIDLPSTLNFETLKDVPRVVNLKDEMTSAKSQDARGTCTFFVAIGLVEAAVKKTMKVDINLSEEYLNYFTKSEGHNAKTEASYTAINLALAIDKNEGFLLESDWPYQPIWFGQKEPCLNFSELEDKAPKICYSHEAPPKEILERRISPKHFDYHSFTPQTTNEIIEFLATKKQPMSMTVPLDSPAWLDDGTVTYTEEQRAKCIAGGFDVCGLHEIIVTGYDLDKKVFFFKNNWGEEWGQAGFGTIPMDVVDRHVEHFFMTAELKEPTELRAELASHAVNFKDFNIAIIEQADGSLSAKSQMVVENGGLYSYRVGIVLVDQDEKEINLSAAEQKQFKTKIVNDGKNLYADKNKSLVEWSADLKISRELMNTKTVKESSSLSVRATLYQFTDGGWKTLKRTYTPLTKK